MGSLQADMETWRRIEADIGLRAIELCRQECDGSCRHACGADRDRDWRNEAIQSLWIDAKKVVPIAAKRGDGR